MTVFDIRQTAEFAQWFRKLDDPIARRAIVQRLARIEIGNFGDHASVGDGVSELRIHHAGGYRAYYTICGRTVVFMLVGGTKRTQARDIERAKRMAKEV